MTVTWFSGDGVEPRFASSPRNAPICTLMKVRGLSLCRNFGHQFALIDRAKKCRLVAWLHANAIGHERAIETRGELRREVARAIGMWHQHVSSASALQPTVEARRCRRPVYRGRAAANRRRARFPQQPGVSSDAASAGPAPSTTAATGSLPASCCAAATASHVALCSFPCRCSATTRIILQSPREARGS